MQLFQVLINKLDSFINKKYTFKGNNLRNPLFLLYLLEQINFETNFLILNYKL